MEEVEIYNFTEQEFRQIKKLADDIYNTSIVLESFCKENIYTYEIQNIFPVLKYLHKNADILNCIFINYHSV